MAAMNKAAPEVVALLLEKGADVHAVDKDERTALHLALENQAGPEVAELLLAKGVSTDGIDLSTTEAGDDQPLLAAAKAKAALVDSKFWKANEGNKDGQLLAKVTDLLEKGADVHAVDEYKRTALHFAAVYKAGPEVVALLLEKGADVHA